jgi:hypothetical protein
MVGQHVFAWVGENFLAQDHQYCLDVGGFVLADIPRERLWLHAELQRRQVEKWGVLTP